VAEARSLLTGLLDALVSQPGVSAALLASEDGAYLLGELSVVPNADILAASALSLHGAAEAALAPGSDERPLTVVAEWGRQRLMTVSVGAGLALVALLQADEDLSRGVGLVETTASRLADAIVDAG